jgi:hypothetical protein
MATIWPHACLKSFRVHVHVRAPGRVAEEGPRFRFPAMNFLSFASKNKLKNLSAFQFELTWGWSIGRPEPKLGMKVFRLGNLSQCRCPQGVEQDRRKEF